MNLFVLDEDPNIAAEYYSDIHVRKICLEVVQVIQTAYSLQQLKSAPKTQTGNVRKHGYYNHPICVWSRKTIGNFEWTLKHAQALHEEFEYRFGYPHFSKCFVEWAEQNIPNTHNGKQTEHPQCFKDHEHLIIPGDPVQGYRNYYKAAKSKFIIHNTVIPAIWTKRTKPVWM